MANIYTTRKKKGTDDNVYPNVKAQNIPMATTNENTTEKVASASLVYPLLTSDVYSSAFTAIPTVANPDVLYGFSYEDQNDFIALASYVYRMDDDVGGESIEIVFKPVDACKVRGDNFTKYLMTVIVPNSSEVTVFTMRRWYLEVTYDNTDDSLVGARVFTEDL